LRTCCEDESVVEVHTWDKSEVKCYNCPNYGHYAYEYREKKNKAFLAKAIIEDDDESALL
jgi:hypothetical protein